MSDALKTQIRDLAGFIDERQRAAAAALRDRQDAEQPVRPDDPVVEETSDLWPGFEDEWDDPPARVWSRSRRHWMLSPCQISNSVKSQEWVSSVTSAARNRRPSCH